MKHIEIRENLHVLTLRCKGSHFASNWLTGGSGFPNQSQSHENQINQFAIIPRFLSTKK